MRGLSLIVLRAVSHLLVVGMVSGCSLRSEWVREGGVLALFLSFVGPRVEKLEVAERGEVYVLRPLWLLFDYLVWLPLVGPLVRLCL
ncbi:MAG: hypothetical protein NZ730_11405 [Porticoccaceae bacterium]|nr:hypothetical protein [Porticoccaceae bacterium]